MAVSADAVRQELLQLAIERKLCDSFASGGTFTCTDAAWLVLRMTGESPDVPSVRQTTAKIFKFLTPQSTVDSPVTKQSFPTAMLGLVTHHFADTWCPPDIIEAVGRDLRGIRAVEESKRRRRAPISLQQELPLLPIADATHVAVASSTGASAGAADAPDVIVQRAPNLTSCSVLCMTKMIPSTNWAANYGGETT